MTEIKRRKIIERAARTAQEIRERCQLEEMMLGSNNQLLKDAENAIMALLGVIKETEKRLDNYKERFDGAVELYRLDDPIRYEVRFGVEELAPLGREQAELLVFEKIMSAMEG